MGSMTFLQKLLDRFSGRSLPLRLEVATQAENRFSIRSIGLAAQQIPELEIVDCPGRLVGYASEIVLQIAANGLRAPGSLADQKTVGGRLVYAEQDFLQLCRLRLHQTDTGAYLRVCDVEESAIDQCPRRLIAAHLCAMGSRGGSGAELLFRLATEEYPSVSEASDAPLKDSELNPNNFWAWEGLGSAHAQASRTGDAILAWKRAVCHWPRCGRFIAERMSVEIAGLAISGADRDVLTSFWKSFDNQTIQEWARELDLRVSESALT